MKYNTRWQITSYHIRKLFHLWKGCAVSGRVFHTWNCHLTFRNYDLYKLIYVLFHKKK
jgi:hypothetical protein